MTTPAKLQTTYRTGRLFAPVPKRALFPIQNITRPLCAAYLIRTPNKTAGGQSKVFIYECSYPRRACEIYERAEQNRMRRNAELCCCDVPGETGLCFFIGIAVSVLCVSVDCVWHRREYTQKRKCIDSSSRLDRVGCALFFWGAPPILRGTGAHLSIDDDGV